MATEIIGHFGKFGLDLDLVGEHDWRRHCHLFLGLDSFAFRTAGSAVAEAVLSPLTIVAHLTQASQFLVCTQLAVCSIWAKSGISDYVLVKGLREQLTARHLQKCLLTLDSCEPLARSCDVLMCYFARILQIHKILDRVSVAGRNL